MIYLLTAIWFTPDGSSTVHIYTQTIHRKTQNKQYIEQHKNMDNKIFGRVWAVPVLYSGSIKKTGFLTILATISSQKRTPCHRIIYSKQTTVPCRKLVAEYNKIFKFLFLSSFYTITLKTNGSRNSPCGYKYMYEIMTSALFHHSVTRTAINITVSI